MNDSKAITNRDVNAIGAAAAIAHKITPKLEWLCRRGNLKAWNEALDEAGIGQIRWWSDRPEPHESSAWDGEIRRVAAQMAEAADEVRAQGYVVDLQSYLRETDWVRNREPTRSTYRLALSTLRRMQSRLEADISGATLKRAIWCARCEIPGGPPVEEPSNFISNENPVL